MESNKGNVMTTLQMPTHDHEQFDEICSALGDFEPLPTVVASPEELRLEPPSEEDQTSLDGLILAGLVSPY
jgi:hypothetical protein